MRALPAAVDRFVRERASHRCEYCQMHSALQGATFHIEHAIPRSRGGSDKEDNLALSCPTCNLVKADRRTLRDPHTGSVVEVFNPRIHQWADHFRFEGRMVCGVTPIGRALVAALELNSSRRLLIRSAEEQAGLRQPSSADPDAG
jgi:HNH endonuclease